MFLSPPSPPPPPPCAGAYQHHSNQCQWSLLACQAASVGCVHTPFRPVLGRGGIEQSLFAFITLQCISHSFVFLRMRGHSGCAYVEFLGRGSVGWELRRLSQAREIFARHASQILRNSFSPPPIYTSRGGETRAVTHTVLPILSDVSAKLFSECGCLFLGRGIRV